MKGHGLNGLKFRIEEADDGFIIHIRGNKEAIRPKLEAIEALINFKQKARAAGWFGRGPMAMMHNFHGMHGEHGHGKHGITQEEESNYGHGFGPGEGYEQCCSPGKVKYGRMYHKHHGYHGHGHYHGQGDKNGKWE